MDTARSQVVLSTPCDSEVTVDTETADMLDGRSVSLGSHGYPQIFWQGQVRLLHRVLLGLERGDGKIADHINRDKLDNRRSNLRVVTAGQNSQNSARRTMNGRPCSSRYRGVSRTRSGKWRAYGQINGQRTELGHFEDELEAAEAARRWREKHMTHAHPT